MDGPGAALIAVVCSVLAVFFAYKAITMMSWWALQSTGIAAVVIGLLFGLWWLFGEARPTGLQLAQKTVGRLHEEQASRNRTLALAGLLFGGAVLLMVVMLLAAGGGTA